MKTSSRRENGCRQEAYYVKEVYLNQKIHENLLHICTLDLYHIVILRLYHFPFHNKPKKNR